MLHYLWLLIAPMVCVALASHLFAAAPVAKIVVEAGKHERVDTPVGIPLKGLADPKKRLMLEEAAGGQRRAVAAQVEAGDEPVLWFILEGKTPAGAVRRYDLVEDAGMSWLSGAEARATQDGVEMVSGKATVLRYHSTTVAPPAGVDSKFAHGAYIHPAWTPSGLVVTDDFPPDHLHQRGIFMAWTKTEFEGRHPDFWNLGSVTGAVRSVGAPSVMQGPVFAGFAARHEWLDLKAPGGEKVILNEVFQVRVWPAGGPGKGYWLWDLTSTQRCAGAVPLALPKYHYGGLGYRGPPDWLKQVNMLTSEGKTRADGNETKGRWCDVSGLSGGKAAGVLILGHPQNFRHPEPLRLNPQQPQICFAPSQEGEWSIQPGKDYVWRYRFCVHDGEMSREQADRLWADFGEPPVVRVEK
ncbi:MAG: PmoA family protein [Planctomycetes bacterium]|nr:PmoA family protein [Planctomycetota bacterium]